MQEMKWQVSQLTGSSLTLCDASGMPLAKIKSLRMFSSNEEQALEIFVPCDNYFVDLVLLSGYAAWLMTKCTNEVIGEVVQAVAGV